MYGTEVVDQQEPVKKLKKNTPFIASEAVRGYEIAISLYATP